MFPLQSFPESKFSFGLKRLCFLLIIPLLVLSSCNNGEKLPYVSNIKISLQTRRLDVDLAQLDTNRLSMGLQQLKQKYPDFLDFYLDTLMGFGIHSNYVDTNQAIVHGLKNFLTQHDYRGLFDTVAKHFPDTKEVDEQITKGYQYMKYYFPDFQVPKIIYLVSGLNNWAAFTVGNNIMGIGLDMFLGDQYPFYRSVGLPDYMDTHLRPSYIPVAVFSATYQDMHPFVNEGRTLLDMMIQKGKQQYFLSKVLPFVDDTTRLGYTGRQLEWCNKSEAQVYNFFVRENLFYETNWEKVLRYVNDAPSATGMPAESPGNIGSWEGLQIVKAYMGKHPKTTMDELFKDSDAEQFLLASGYRPK
ncbi:MAG TPA: hypothetical protein VN721_17095 [Flavipsychrobacter sp.]|nr:hypothetical protein [Flavipsychrobacter sp.]